MKLSALPYHKEVAGYLRTGEAALWSWFESDQFSQRYADMVKLELLKSTYRLTRADQPEVYAHADTAAEKLGLDLPVTVYQSHGAGGEANAALVFLPDEAALVLNGNIGDLLSEEEMLAVFSHELSHHRLYSLDGGQYFTAARLLDWCAAQPACEDSIQETARLYRLHTEIYADMGALHATGNRDAVISSLIKVSTGLTSVNPLSYSEQTEEILEKRREGSAGQTHPELHIRAKSLDLLAGDFPDLEALTALVSGPLDAKRLDLPGQHNLSGVIRRLVDAVLAPDFMRGEYAANLARRYFEDYEMPADGPEAGLARLAAKIAPFSKSCHEVFAYVLLDFATADPDGGDFTLTWTLNVADRLGLLSVYELLVRKELKRKKDAIAKLRRSAQPEEKASHA
jgi:Zn-dependent protease with chaperone function